MVRECSGHKQDLLLACGERAGRLESFGRRYAIVRGVAMISPCAGCYVSLHRSGGASASVGWLQCGGAWASR